MLVFINVEDMFPWNFLSLSFVDKEEKTKMKALTMSLFFESNLGKFKTSLILFSLKFFLIDFIFFKYKGQFNYHKYSSIDI